MIRTACRLAVLLAAPTALAQPAGDRAAAGSAATPDIAADAEMFEPEAEPEPVLDVRARLRLRYLRVIEDDDPAAGHLRLSHARFELTFHPVEPVEGVLGVDLAPVVSGEDVIAELLPKLLDAYIDVQANEWLGVRAGHRKVPFSGARLISQGDLRPVLRAEYTGFLSADLAGQIARGNSLDYSGRKVGLDLKLRVRRLARLRVDVGLSEGQEGAADPAGRASVRIVKGFRLAAAATAIRISETETRPARWAPAYELDLLYDRDGWRAELEGATGTNWRDRENDPFLGGQALVAYAFPLGPGLEPALEPVVRVELVDETTNTACDETLGVTAGVALRTLEVLRVQLNVERLERPSKAPNGDACGDADDETTIVAQIAFDL